MKYLAIDTATEACSVALSVEGKIQAEFEICPQAHSQKLLPMVEGVLKDNNVALTELDFLAFGRGPGSFTGVRIATGMLQGLALGSERPVVAVSTLAAMAQQAFDETEATCCVAAIDARMDEVYFAIFDKVDGLARCIGEEAVLSPQDAVKLLPDEAFIQVGTGWEAYTELQVASQFASSSSILYPSAEHMLKLAEADFVKGIALSVEQIEPVYLRDKVTWKKLPGRE
ncbi:tRNA (adenosine(37)-N6)-threonylcarbamoyltransferase complex dimerization subunit type 1 TsaB [Aestuariibacter sp. AA17]|uniref:tRNA threonylcarbamoyladenosine biosynthesis protein TsaB n=1 Tax=Fluctibacter corallii TaxID=2984329 RepID=A0ABT3A8W6_9ALTE|nr:tRNA (adenosine(37)-N6)-threonylcarbamoyltransferase complex dimerization subunit type 1 TsaB [Aestuariibacter sp. AA17]MCV2885094.1 tRNA (adenosine(37)-N6)-threonylcarbamoyltransferase complex dimerization subunit type 1 TsaB [Aestuariibacter sp. AA17]